MFISNNFINSQQIETIEMNDHSIGFVGDVMSIKLSSVTMVPNPIKPYLSRYSLITSLNLNQIVNIQIIML